ncbi:class I SAM-dependent methyltransferase [Streptomyces cinnabarinus]|uniref:Class I SAM-dependent methyltransferase n=1 Tax=Streptomyces cinnabarinus TaxID=67287 RepID=A0ABY7KNQ1_9ACTN|nr:class I SAM-dependent methyltransferase [Streptomyces cinnabarinus]WAZ25190.1 class I SAM-dependent methyltransferase [Streptomyces cinnabarinus]
MAHDHAHEHAHHHDHTDIDWADMAEHLETQAELFTPLHEHALAWLGGKQTEPGLIVDAGSGPGVVSCLLADSFPGARVVAVDGSEPLLHLARERAERLGVADRFATLTGELPDVMADLDYPADLIWAGNSLHHLGDQQAAIRAYAERLAVGGTLALVEGGLPTRFLPRDFGIGRPGLEARIDALQADWFADMRANLPDSVPVPEDWRAMMSAAGLKPSGTRTFLLDLPAPATDRARAVAAATFGRLRESLADALDATDRATLDRLLDPDDKASVHHRPDLYVLTARTVHTAVRTG